MEKKKLCLLILLFFTLLILLVSFATKGAYLNTIPYKSYLTGEVLPGMVGVIVMDVFLFVLFLAVTFLIFKPHGMAFKVIAILIILLLFIRFILAMLFLAGDGNSCQRAIERYNKFTPEEERMASANGSLDQLRNLKGAWVWEIITCLFLYVLSGAVIYLSKGLIESSS
jgi:hypothetical protein